MLAVSGLSFRQVRDVGLRPFPLHSSDRCIKLCPPFQRGREGHDGLMMLGAALSVSPAFHEMDVVLVVGKDVASFGNKLNHLECPKQSRSSDNLSTFMTSRQWGCENFACNGKTNRFCVGSGFTPKPSQFAAAPLLSEGVG